MSVICHKSGKCMEVLREKDRELYDKLVRLAGGNSAIVLKCLSNRKRQYVTLRDLIEEIQRECVG
jgi:hypothetical protein